MSYLSNSERRSGADRRQGETVTPEMEERRSGVERRSGKDRRRKVRLTLNTNCPTTFSIGGESKTALMMNLNDLGAMLRSRNQEESFSLANGEEHDYEVQTPYGKASCRGKIIWSRVIDGFFSWGIEFSRLSEDEQDPLLCLMDSPF